MGLLFIGLFKSLKVLRKCWSFRLKNIKSQKKRKKYPLMASKAYKNKTEIAVGKK